MDLSMLGFTAIPAITVICFLLAQAAKAWGMNPQWLPVLVGAIGGILGIVESIINPATINGDILSGIAIGIVSGLAATGAHQVYSQLSK